MNIQSKVTIVTGGASGIGRALCRRFAREGARVVVVDLDGAAAKRVADEIGTIFCPANVGTEADLCGVVKTTVDKFGHVDVFCSNAGIMVEGGEDVLDADWRRILDVNLMAHVYAARAVLPGMLARGEGYLLQTVSAAGLLSQIGSAPYSVTKHAALAFAEWLSITYGDRGIRVSAVCPQGVRTNMLKDAEAGPGAFLLEGALDPEQVAEEVLKGMNAEQFLILPHPEVAEYFRRKAGDYDRWIRGMRKLQARVMAK